MVQKYITLNTWSKQPATLLAVQGESQAREIIAVLIDASGVPVDLTGRTARMYVEKSDRTTVFFNGVTKDAANGVVSFILPLQTTAAAGSANCQIIITDASGATLVSYGLKLDVVSSRANGVLESTSEFTALQEALATVQDIDSRVLRSAQIAGVAINDGITLAQLLSAGLAAGTGGAANNALALGGVEAANYAQVSSGAWTPEIKGTTNAGVATYSDRWGNFTKIGNLCHVECAFALTSLGGATGNILIYGLPFGTYNSMSPVNIGFYFGTSIPETHLSLGGYTMPNSNFVQLIVIGRNGSENLKNEYITDNFLMGCLSCDYIVGGG